MEPLPAGLILLGLTTPAIIAYRHPTEYRRLAWVLLVINAVGVLLLEAWQLGYDFGTEDAFGYLSTAIPQVTGAPKQQFAAHAVNLAQYSFYACAGGAYIWMLMGLQLVGLVQKGPDK